MPEKRFFQTSDSFQKGTSLSLEDKEFHHLRVMRLNPLDQIELVNGKNELATAQIEEIAKDHAKIKVLEVHHQKPPLPTIILIQALTKLPKLDLIVEKATELGASAFWFFPGENSEKKEISEKQISRLRSISISAMKQCGRLDLPQIEIHSDLKCISPSSKNAFFGDFGENSQKLSHYQIERAEPIYIFIGPEKGWSEKERDILKILAKPLKLHPYILRAETAALYSVGLFSFAIE